MIDWEPALHAFIKILENPRTKKGYVQLKKYYSSLGMVQQESALEYLIEKRFNSVDSPNTNKQQRKDD